MAPKSPPVNKKNDFFKLHNNTMHLFPDIYDKRAYNIEERGRIL